MLPHKHNDITNMGAGLFNIRVGDVRRPLRIPHPRQTNFPDSSGSGSRTSSKPLSETSPMSSTFMGFVPELPRWGRGRSAHPPRPADFKFVKQSYIEAVPLTTSGSVKSCSTSDHHNHHSMPVDHCHSTPVCITNTKPTKGRGKLKGIVVSGPDKTIPCLVGNILMKPMVVPIPNKSQFADADHVTSIKLNLPNLAPQASSVLEDAVNEPDVMITTKAPLSSSPPVGAYFASTSNRESDSSESNNLTDLPKEILNNVSSDIVTSDSDDGCRYLPTASAKPLSWEEYQLLNPPKIDRCGKIVREPARRYCLANDFPSLPSGVSSMTVGDKIVEALSRSKDATVEKKINRKNQKKKSKIIDDQATSAVVVVDVKNKKAIKGNDAIPSATKNGTVVVENLHTDVKKVHLQDFFEMFGDIVGIMIVEAPVGTSAEITYADEECCDSVVAIVNNSTFKEGGSPLSVWKKGGTSIVTRVIE